MAQHYLIKDEKILRSINRIVPKVFNDIKHGMLMDWSYYNKDVQHLPKEYNPSGHAFLIKPYDMARVWKDEPYAEVEACLEVHLNNNGDMTDVYYPL